MPSQISIADAWIGRDAFYEARVACRPRENDRFYHQLVRKYYSFLVPPGANVLEMGCGLGDLLAEVKPSHGLGIDFSAKTIALARERHPDLGFELGDAARWEPTEKSGRREIGKPETPCGGPRWKEETIDVARVSDFSISAFPDYILLADLINDLPDVQAVFEHLRALSHPRTRLVLNFLNTLWRPALAVAEWIGAKAPSPLQNWLSTADVKNLLHLAGWEIIKEEHRILWPLHTPVLAAFLNRWLAPLLPHCCLSIFLVARPRWAHEGIKGAGRGIARDRDRASGEPSSHQPKLEEAPLVPGEVSRVSDFSISTFPDFTCSVIIPARNEAGNIEATVLRTPELGLGTELIFVEGHSTDKTWEEVQRIARKYPHRNIKGSVAEFVGS